MGLAALRCPTAIAALACSQIEVWADPASDKQETPAVNDGKPRVWLSSRAQVIVEAYKRLAVEVSDFHSSRTHGNDMGSAVQPTNRADDQAVF